MSVLKTKKREPVKPLTPAAAAREAEALLIMARSRADLEAVQAQAQLDAEIRDAKAKEVRAALDQEAKAGRSKVWATSARTWTTRVVPFSPLVMVNTVAVYGQLGWGRANLDQIGSSPDDLARWSIALLFAATLESIALFLAYYANRSMHRGDSATALYLGAFGMAAVVAMINYSHYASPLEAEQVTPFGLATVPGPTAMAVVCAMCSIASPWLWRIKHRDANRDRLHELGAIDAKAVRLSMARKIFYPVRSYRVTRMAVWVSETDPARAVRLYEAKQAEVRAAKDAKALGRANAKDATPLKTKAERVVKAEKPPAVTAPPPAPALPPAPAAAPAVTAPPAPAAAPAVTAPPAPAAAPAVPELATRHPQAWEALRRTTAAGNTISQRQLAANYLHKNRHHAVALVTAFRQWKELNQHVNGASNTTP